MADYHRTAEQKRNDFADARVFEEAVATALPNFKITRFTSTDELDIWVPGFFLDVKEKKQRLTSRWQLFDGVPERDLMVLDELGIRRALKHWPEAYFLLKDVPEGRLFLASITEVVCAERVRRNRVGKGKWIVNLQNFRRIARLEDITHVVMADMVALPWKRSECLTQLEVAQI